MKQKNGFTFLEVIMALLVLSIAIIPLTLSLSGSLENEAKIQHKAAAAFLAQEKMEEVKGKSIYDFDGPSGLGYGEDSWTEFSTNPGYYYIISDDYDPAFDIKTIIVTVWFDEDANNNDETDEKVELVTRVARRE